MAALITIEQAKTQLRIPWSRTDQDEDLNARIVHASAIVTDYLEDFLTDLGSPGWDVDTDPLTVPQFAIVQAAILEVLTNLWRNRGDAPMDGPLTDRVVNMLRGLKLPALG